MADPLLDATPCILLLDFATAFPSIDRGVAIEVMKNVMLANDLRVARVLYVPDTTTVGGGVAALENSFVVQAVCHKGVH